MSEMRKMTIRERKLSSNAIFPLSEASVQLFLFPSKNSIDLNMYLFNYSEFKYISDSRQSKEPCLAHSHNLCYLFLLTEVKAVIYEIEIIFKNIKILPNLIVMQLTWQVFNNYNNCFCHLLFNTTF